MVVSEIGEAWSPPTAPDRIAATVITSRFWSPVPITAMAIGIRMPKVPQEVPVAKARIIATIKKIAGRKTSTLALALTSCPT